VRIPVFIIRCPLAFVPEGQPIIAHGFNCGLKFGTTQVPEGRLEVLEPFTPSASSVP
jgi:hypothetical protein